MAKKRLYTEKDFSAIMRRAAELQRTEGADDSPGLSLQELEQIADDVGIDAGFVRRAAFELDEGEPEKGDLLLGGPTRIDVERIIDGHMSDASWEDALGEIRRAFAAEGEIRQEGRSRDWIHRDQMGARIHVSLSPAEDQTRIRITYGMTEWMWLHFIFLSIGIGGIAVSYALLNLGILWETGVALLIMVAFYMVGWISFRFFTRKQDRKVRSLMGRLDDLLSEPESAAAEPAASAVDRTADQAKQHLLSEDIPDDKERDRHRRARERT